MGAASQYARSFGHVTLRAHRSIQAAFGAVTLAAAAVTGWRFGTAWGTATALGCLFAIAVYTGVSIQERLNEASNSAGTKIPTGWSAIVDGGLLSRVRLCGRAVVSVLKESPTYGKTPCYPG